ncbi:AbrB/MazE/SpoVT family DNA-binding domain-containing protein [Halobellus rubicundus]|uniref:AbrB/MazE/SpoVT family DNA-binding domain-containing protein n=1 Tax=Halobellus rubicundus TaxID=2996466 RepID=A0ABD5M895_9EURY
METRKIQRVSNGTYTVSLPREWATEQGLSAGDVVQLHAHLDGPLTIQPATDDLSRLELPIAEESRTQVTRLLRAAYTAGALDVDVVAADGLDDDQRTALRSTVRALSGVTIAEESDTTVAVRNVLDSEQVSIRQSVRHLRFVALSHHREATAALCDPEIDAGPATDDARADRLSAVVERYFVRSLSRLDEVDRLGEGRPDLFCFFQLADDLRRIAACADRIATVAADFDSPSDPDADPDRTDTRVAAFETVAEDAREAVETAVDTVFDPDTDAVWNVLERRDAVRTTVDDLGRRLFEAPDGEYRLARALPAIRETADCAASIASIGLRRTLQQRSLGSAGLHDSDSAGTDPPVPSETDD